MVGYNNIVIITDIKMKFFIEGGFNSINVFIMELR